jgi:hypothetical protein
MKRIVCGMMVMLSVLVLAAGCNQSNEQAERRRLEPDRSITAPAEAKPLLTVVCPSGSAKIMERTWNAASRQVTLLADVQSSHLPEGRYRIDMQSCRWGNTEQGARLSLYGPTSILLYEYTFRWDAANLTWVSISERTPDDEMTIVRAVRGDSIHEAYEINGSNQSFGYSKRILDYWHAQLPADSLSQGELQLADQISTGFQTFYQDRNSLHDNTSGELLLQLTSDQTLLAWIAPLSARHQREQMQKVAFNVSAEDICTIAAICDKLKCLWGGLVNPLCVPCIGIDAACLITDAVTMIAGWFSDDD